ncbi:MAG: peptide deformylase [Rhodocyclaceae bacterium]|nr:peptide deformylase [Rhodocyclaceae bacterium]
MAIRPILKMGTPSLMERSRELSTDKFGSAELMSLLQDMKETMIDARGAGLAAPQIGENVRVVIFEVRENPRYPGVLVPFTVLINPVITPLSDQLVEGWEGCLSVPGLRGAVQRYDHIHYTGFDAQGNPIDRTVQGFHARVVQHECDHLDGVLYPMRMKDMSKFGFTDILFPHLAPYDDD